jgi:Domain of unknown function (DUF1814).
MKRPSSNLNVNLRRFEQEKGMPNESASYRYISEGVWRRVVAAGEAENLIAKGGFILGEIFGLENRTSQDLDMSFVGTHPADEVQELFEKALAIELDDELHFDNIRTKFNPGKLSSPLDGFSVKFDVYLPPNANKPDRPIKFLGFKIDITDGEHIVPPSQRFDVNLIMTNETLSLVSYPTERMVAEKMEAVLHHGENSTRTRDFADLHDFNELFGASINLESLKESFEDQVEVRDTIADETTIDRTLLNLFESPKSAELWRSYQDQFNIDYTWEEAMTAVEEWFAAIELIQPDFRNVSFPLSQRVFGNGNNISVDNRSQDGPSI